MGDHIYRAQCESKNGPLQFSDSPVRFSSTVVFLHCYLNKLVVFTVLLPGFFLTDPLLLGYIIRRILLKLMLVLKPSIWFDNRLLKNCFWMIFSGGCDVCPMGHRFSCCVEIIEDNRFLHMGILFVASSILPVACVYNFVISNT